MIKSNFFENTSAALQQILFLIGTDCCLSELMLMSVPITRPKVDSVVLQITRNYMVTKELIEIVNKLFSYRRKTIQNIAKNFGITIKSNSRLEDMNNNEIIKLAKKISRV